MGRHPQSLSNFYDEISLRLDIEWIRIKVQR